jgi:hypothetical protein
LLSMFAIGLHSALGRAGIAMVKMKGKSDRVGRNIMNTSEKGYEGEERHILLQTIK